MDHFCILLILALVLLFTQETLQTRSNVRRAVSQSNRRYQCGVRKRQVEGLITNGSNTKLGEWPWHGGLFHRKNRRSREYKCGATLVHQNYVITASHCVVDRESGYEVNAGTVTVDFGYVQLFSASSHGQSHTVQEIIVHPEFAKDSNKHDVALLSLKTAVRFSDYVLPICVGLTRSETNIHDIIGKQGVVVGWGLTEDDENSSDLKIANLPIVDYPQCQEADPDLFGPLIYPGMFCAGSRDGTSVCNGDSGGGMYVQDGRKWFLRGITSFSGAREDGSNKCDVNKYAGFVNVQYYASWIREMIEGEDDDLTVSESSTQRTTTTTQPQRPSNQSNGWPVPESPRETTSTLEHTNYRHRESYSSCPNGQSCLEMGVCNRARLHRVSPSGRPSSTQPCEVTEHNSFRVIKYCCQLSEPDRYGGMEIPGRPYDQKTLCGQRQSSSHVTVTPKPAFPNEYPWMVKLKNSQDVFECQGALVTRSHVLISAYCRPRNGITSARLGRFLRGTNRCPDNHCVEIAVKSVIAHPRFDADVDSNDHSDFNIALAELATPVEISDYINTICFVNPDSEKEFKYLIAAGWKITNFRKDISTPQRAGFNTISVTGIADSEALQHVLISNGPAYSNWPQEMFFSQGTLLQWVDDVNGQVGLVGIATHKDTSGNETYKFALAVPEIFEWILSVAGND